MWDRRSWLKSLGGLPVLRRLGAGAAAAGGAPGKFTPIDMQARFNCAPSDFPDPAGRPLQLPAGERTFLGLPFRMAEEGAGRKAWLALSRQALPWAAAHAEIGLGRTAHYLCLAQFCNWDANESHPPGVDTIEKVGQPLADAILVYEDGGRRSFPIRRRFEVNAPSVMFGHLAFNALPHGQASPRKLSDALPGGGGWGILQTLVRDASGNQPIVWIWALENPEPRRAVAALHLDAAADDPLFVCALTLFHEPHNPLLYDRLATYRITLPEPSNDERRWQITADLGIVARTFMLAGFEAEAWLKAPEAGLGGRGRPDAGNRYLYVEATASPAATLTLRDGRTGAVYEFDLGKAAGGTEVEARGGGPRIEFLAREKTWVHGTVVDAATGKPTPVRLSFRGKEGRYIPPYGHRTDINDGWFQDYGADLKLGDTSFAYVDGTFQIELPAGEVYVEMTKGFEYEAVRKKVEIRPGQRELRLEIPRHTDLRARGWVTADTHVHFLSPSTAVLEGQAEGLNLINLLAAQWGELFTNVGDLAHGPITSADGQTIVWVGTENRQHILGHINLLGGSGRPVFPMSVAGPGEGSLGQPLWRGMADWADACRAREGLVVWPHFPYPTGEIAADIVLGKIDAVELYPRDGIFDNLRFNDWYRYLNCGYRLPAAGGTDKMNASVPAGSNRTYAWLGGERFTFANWAKAVRRGNTFVTSGPLLLLEVEGRRPGDEIVMPAGGGTVEARVEAASYVPFHRVELVFNGRVVAAREEPGGVRALNFSERVKVPGPGWLAARCASRLGPPASWVMGIAAHTSPVYLPVPGQELFSPPAAAYFLTLIDGAETWVRNLATRPGPEDLARILRTFSDARERLHRRLHGGQA